jgi:hypothetical protein
MILAFSRFVQSSAERASHFLREPPDSLPLLYAVWFPPES